MPDLSNTILGATESDALLPATPVARGTSLAPKLGTSSLADAITGADVQQAERVRSGMTQATTPDNAARVLKLQAKTGLAPDVIERNLDTVEQQAKRQDFDAEAFRRDNPNLAQWVASDRMNGALAADDVETLSTLDKVIQAGKRGVLSLRQFLPTFGAIGDAKMIANFDALDAKLANGVKPADIPDSQDLAGYRWMNEEERSTLRRSVSGSLSESTASIAQREVEKRQYPVDPTVAKALGAKNFGDFWREFTKKPVEFIATVGAESLPASAPGLLAAIPAGAVGGVPGAAAAIGAGSFTSDYASTVLDALRDEGVDLSNADAVRTATADKAIMGRVGARAFAHASVVGLFDAASGGIASKTLIPQKLIANRVGRAAANVAAQAPVQGAMGAAGEAGGEIAAGQKLDAGQIGAEFFGEFVGTPAEVGTMTLSETLNRVQQARAAKQQESFFTALGQGVSDSKTFQRLPEKLREFIAQATKDGPIENVYVEPGTWATYWQSQGVDPRAAAGEVLGDEAAYDTALAAGHDLAIPLDAYATKVAPTEHNAFFARELRLRPDEMNAREAEAFEQTASNDAEETLRRILESPVDTAGKVREDVVGQLLQAGFDQSTAESYAGMYEAAFRTLGERAGVDPSELYGQYGLKVQRPLPDVLSKMRNVDEFDKLLDRLRGNDVPTDADMFGKSLGDFVRENGGLRDEGGELKSRDAALQDKGKRREHRLVRDEGRSFDDMRELAAEAGYLPMESDVNDFINLIDSEVRGDPVFAPGNQSDEHVALGQRLAELDRWIKAQGINLNALTNQQIKAIIAEAQKNEGTQGDDIVFGQDGEPMLSVDGKLRPVKNSKGQPIAAGVPELIAFWKWFGDSKVVDENGRPLVVYHGTTADFDEFAREKQGSAWTMSPGMPVGFWFAKDAALASHYAKKDGGNVMPAYLRAVDFAESYPDFTTDQRFDGYENREVVVVRDPAQIKSAIGNVGTFDPLSGNILHQGEAKPSPDDVSAWADSVKSSLGLQHFRVYLRSDGSLKLDAIEVSPDNRKQGAGSAAMEALTAYADEHNLRVILSPALRDDRHGTTSRSRLVRFYKRFGFVENKGRRKDFTISEGMYREPKSTTLSQGDDNNRGSIRFGADRQFNIDLLQRADLSTFIHETGHFYLEVLGDLADQLRAKDEATLTDQQRRMLADYDALLKWFGVKDRTGIAVEHHEQWARGIEAYVLEGKAPSPALRSIFARFRAWLTAIYRSFKQLNVELTPEVRNVMDRIFASDEEIKAAEAEAKVEALFTTPEQAGMTPDDFAAYRDTVQAASDKARDELQAKLMRQLTREREAWWKKQRESVRESVSSEVNGRPEYIALSVLQTGKMPDGSEAPVAMKLDRDALRETYGREFLKRLPRPYVYAVDGGVHPDVAAEAFGFTSGDALLNALVNARPMKALIEAETDQRMRETYGDMLTDGTLADEARAAVQNEERTKVIHAELRALNKGIEGAVIPQPAQIRAIAQGRIAQMRVREIQPHTYLLAARRAAQRAFEALSVHNDRVEAVRAKQQELMNHALYRETTAAREEVERVAEYMRSFETRRVRERIGKAGVDYLEQIDAIVERFSFERLSMRAMDKRKALAAWIAEKERQGQEINLPDEILDESRRVPYRELTYENLLGVRDAVKHIEHVARLKNKLLKSKAKRELDAVVADLDQSIRDNGKRKKKSDIETRLPGDEGARLARWFFASHRKLSSFARQMDGFKDGGTVWEYLVRPLNDAADAEATMNADATKRLAGIFAQAYPGKETSALYRKSETPVGVSLTKMARLMIALNWGNEGNRQRIMDGYRWTEAQVDSVLADLDERDWQFVRDVWKFVDSFWPQIKAKQERVEGVAPEKVAPAKVRTKFGEIDGGYFPLKYDDRLSARAGSNLESEVSELANKAAYVRATTRRGHTKERAEKVEMPVRLDFGVIFEHTQQVIHDLTHHEMLMDAGRILGSRTVQSAIYDAYGEVVYKEIKGLFTDVAIGEAPAINAFEKSINWLRQGTSIAGLGWNFFTALQQPFGLAQSMVRIGPKWVMKGVSRWIRDAASMENSVRWIRDRSSFMQQRGETQLREINEIRNRVGLNTGKLSGWVDQALRTTTFDKLTKQAVVDSFFSLIHAMQTVADVPTWLGAYEKAMAGGEAEERAISLADQAVIDAQGGGQVKDLAGIQRGGPLLKLWTNFYSYFNVTYNLTVESARRTRFRDPVAVGRFAVDFVLLYTVPATMGFLLKQALGKNGDDDDKFVEGLTRDNLSYMTGVLVLLREVSSTVQGFQGYEGPAGARFFSSVAKLVKQSEQGEADKSFWHALNSTAGTLLHYPSGQVQRSADGFAALAEGRTRNPLALLFGPPKE